MCLFLRAPHCVSVCFSAYGKLLQRNSRFKTVRFCEPFEASSLVSDVRFDAIEEINEGLFEVCLRKKSYMENTPKLLGFFVLGYAKLFLLQ